MAEQESGRLLVVLAATSWDGVWMSERHLALQLSERLPVLWVDPPLSWVTAMRNPQVRSAVRGPRLSRVGPRIHRLAPVTVPGFTRPGLRAVADRQIRFAVRRAVRRLGLPVAAVVTASLEGALDVVPAEVTMLYGTDDWVAGADLMGLDRGWLERAERRRVLQADVVVSISEPLRDRWQQFRDDVVVVPNGCAVDQFAATDEAPLPTDVRLPAPIAGFVGHLSDRIDLARLEAVADTGVSLLLVGPKQQTYEIDRIGELLARDNVQWVGPKRFAELPSYLRCIRVGLTPYADSEFNRASFPLKTLEYLAAGRPVVSTDLPAAHWLATPEVRISTTAADFAAQTRDLLGHPDQAADRAHRRAFAAGHSWARRADRIAELLNLGAIEQTRVRA